jgi:ribosomal protein S18 acetylase RimI-like enzyme
MTIVVVPGGTDRLDEVEPLWLSMLAAHADLTGDRLPMRAAEQSWPMRRGQYVGWLKDGSGLLLLAQDESRTAVGYAFVRWRASGPTWDFGPLIGEIESLAVAPWIRGSGAGTALVEASREALRERGIEYWCVDVVETNPAQRLYERAGFEPNFRKMFARLDAGGTGHRGDSVTGPSDG